MAISLLQNASHMHQEAAARHVMELMRQAGWLDMAESKVKQDALNFLFPSYRRSRFQMLARHLVELLKHLPKSVQLEMATQLISVMYCLDCGIEGATPPSLEVVQDACFETEEPIHRQDAV